jgi:hypothetical protein
MLQTSGVGHDGVEHRPDFRERLASPLRRFDLREIVPIVGFGSALGPHRAVDLRAKNRVLEPRIVIHTLIIFDAIKEFR